MTHTVEVGSATIHHGSAAAVLPRIAPAAVDLLWTDPPFNTGDTQRLARTGHSFVDRYDDLDDYLGMLGDVFAAAKPLMAPTGVVAVCLDWRAVHDVKVLVLDRVFGRDRFRGEIVWHSELGGVSKTWWTNKHNTVLVYAAGDRPRFDVGAVPTTTRRAPRGDYTSAERRVNSVWPITLSPTSKERAGYPNQKPVDLIRPFVEVHCPPGGLVLDPFMGSGSTLVAATLAGRRAVGIDSNLGAVDIAASRLRSTAVAS